MSLSCRGSSPEWPCVSGRRSLGPPPASTVGSEEPPGQGGVPGPRQRPAPGHRPVQPPARSLCAPPMAPDQRLRGTDLEAACAGQQTTAGGGRRLCSRIPGRRLSSRVARRWARPSGSGGPAPALALFLLPSAPARPPFFRPFASFVGLETGAPRATRGKAQRGEAVQALRHFRGAPAGVPGPRVCVHVHAHARTHTRL